MSLDTNLKMRYQAPFEGFNPRADWQAYQNRLHDPWGYLDSIGIHVVVEMLHHGLHPRAISRQLNVSQNVLLKWIEVDDDRRSQYDWAFENAATNEMYDARDIVDSCGLTSEEINKAGKQAEHRRHLAKGLGARRWGAKLDVNATTTATVNYNFNVELLPHQKQALEGQAQRIEKDQQIQPLDFNELLGSGLGAIDLSIGVKDKDGLSYEEAAAQEAGSEEKDFEAESNGEGQEEDGGQA